jgi:hypothetical protein
MQPRTCLPAAESLQFAHCLNREGRHCCAGLLLVSLCKGNMWFSLAEGFVVLPRAGTSLFLVPRGGGALVRGRG